MICIINENCKFRATGLKNKHRRTANSATKQFIYYVQTLYTVYYIFCVIQKLLIIIISVNASA